MDYKNPYETLETEYLIFDHKHQFDTFENEDLMMFAKKYQEDIDHNMTILNTAGLNFFNKRGLRSLIEKYTYSLKSVNQVLP